MLPFRGLLAVAALSCLELGAADPIGTPSPTVNPAPDPVRELTVRLYDYAGLDPRTLHLARKQAEALFAKAGVRWRWQQCRTSAGDAPSDAGCAERTGPHLLQLRLHPRKMAKKMAGGFLEFGYAIPVEDGHGVIAGVYVERADVTAREVGLDLHVVLGHLMAHEIGHLLLGVASHSRSGVMQAKWGDHEMRLARVGAIEFSERQAQRMRSDVAERTGRARETPLLAVDGNR